MVIMRRPTTSRLRCPVSGLWTSLPGLFTQTIVPHICAPQGEMRTRVSPLWLSQVPIAPAPRAGWAGAGCAPRARRTAAAPYAFTLMMSLQNHEAPILTLKLDATKGAVLWARAWTAQATIQFMAG